VILNVSWTFLKLKIKVISWRAITIFSYQVMRARDWRATNWKWKQVTDTEWTNFQQNRFYYDFEKCEKWWSSHFRDFCQNCFACCASLDYFCARMRSPYLLARVVLWPFWNCLVEMKWFGRLAIFWSFWMLKIGVLFRSPFLNNQQYLMKKSQKCFSYFKMFFSIIWPLQCLPLNWITDNRISRIL